ncbi:MAG: hypothetical protein LBP19_03705 [Treponema sp.]|jgi:hypothetical protein|nr:hypothetical protein [Treponema sp.]
MAIFEKRIVAFIDILGFTNLVKTGAETENETTLEDIYNILKYLSAWQTRQPNTWDHRFINSDPDVQQNTQAYEVKNLYCTCFSDSLVVSMPYDDMRFPRQFSTFVSNLAHIGSKLIQLGVLIRGGIAKGKLMHDSQGIIFGPAFNEAYDIERNKAEYPRIILSADLVNLLYSYPTNSGALQYPYRYFLKRFDDGCVGLHQMTFFEYQHAIYSNELTRSRTSLLKKLDEHLCDPKVFRKYRWLTDELNTLDIDCTLKIKTDLTDGGTKPYNIFYREVNPDSTSL